MTPLSFFSVNLLSEHLLLFMSVLIFSALLVMKVGSKFGVPSLLLFLIMGMVAGADGLGLQFADYEGAEFIGHLAITIIIFTAGLETSLEHTRPVFKPGIMLSTVGLLLTILFTGTFIYLIVGGQYGAAALGCFLLPAVMGSTDSASVFALLNDKKLHLRENLAPMLELESGSNDPLAYSATLILIKIITSMNATEASAGALGISILIVIALQIVVGVAVGLAVGQGARWILKKVSLPSVALYSIMILSIGFFANGIATVLHGNGLLALYITAITIANKVELKRKKEILSFFNGMTWLMQLLMFLMLGLLARPSTMLSSLGPALLIGLFLMFVARPASVLISLAPFRKLSFKAKLFTSWVGLKGAGPILFALAPVIAGIDGATDIFNTVFLITLISMVLQGMTLEPFARALNLTYEKDPEVETFGMDIPEEMGLLRDHIVSDSERENGSTLRDLGLPHGIRVMMVRRGDRFLVPHGSMVLEKGDHLIIIMGESDD